MARIKITRKLLKQYFGKSADISERFFGSGYHVKMPSGAGVEIGDWGMKNFRGGPEIYGPAMKLAHDVWGKVSVEGTPLHVINSMIHGQEVDLPVAVRQKRSWFKNKPVPVPKVSGAQGSAAIATVSMIRDSGLTGGKSGRGLRLGEDDAGNIIRYKGQCGISIIGPPRSGKQASLATSMIVENEDAAWCLVDPKLELLAITHRRRAALGPVRKIVPFKEGLPQELWHHADETDSFNPLHFMDPRSQSYVIANDLLSETVIVPEGSGDGKDGGGFFTENAQGAVSSVCMHLVEKFPKEATLPKMASIISGPDLFPFAADAMINGSQYVRDRIGVFGNPSASRMQGGINDILRTLIKGLKWLSDPAMKRVLETPRNPWRFDDLKRGSRPMTIYVGVPSKFAQAARGLTRLLFGCAASDLLSSTPGERQVNLLADEFHTMGRVSIFETCFSEGAGHGLAMIPICQTAGQLISAYGEQGYRNIQAGCEIQINLPPRDMAQALEIAKLAGRKTILTASMSASSGSGNREEEWGGISLGEAGAEVLDAHSAMALGADRMVISAPGLVRDIIIARRRRYWEYPEILKHCDANPYAPGGGSGPGGPGGPQGGGFLRWMFG
jgi:type IV secretory pathway TraG/TraD family ATPase VirD4